MMNDSIIYPKNMENATIKTLKGSDAKALEFVSLRDGRYRRKNMRDAIGSSLQGCIPLDRPL